MLASLLPSWPGVLFRQRPDLTIEMAGGALEELTGHPVEDWECDKGLFWELLHESDLEPFRHNLARCGSESAGLQQTFRLRHARTGRVRHLLEFRQACFDATGRVIAYEGYWIDVTRQTTAERRLAGTAWKETLGLLTLGLAHDFNNVLAGILGLSDTLLEQLPPEHPLRSGVVLMKQKSQQGAQLIQRIAQLHQARTGQRGYFNLNDVVKENRDLVRRVVPKRIEIVEELDPAPLPLYVDGTELQQVLLNLVLNAAEAMPERGTLTLLTAQQTDVPQWEHGAGTAPRAPIVCLTVRDSGIGVKPRFLPWLFDPFFTTKPMNVGSGLGLYNARLFAEKHQGAISVESRENAGATFRLWLPMADFSEADMALRQFQQRRRALLLCGQSGPLLEGTAAFLRQNSYRVVIAAGDAEELLNSSDDTFDGVLLLVEPRDPAPLTLVRLLRTQKLPVKIVLKAVGCHPDELAAELSAGADLVIAADLSGDTLLKRLADVLDAPVD